MGNDTMHRDNSHDALLRVLAGRDAQAGAGVADRTRRAVRVRQLDQIERKERIRYSSGLAILALGGLLLLLAPGLWCSVEEFLDGEHFSDLHAQIALLVLLMFAAVVGALIASRRTSTTREERDSS